MAAHSVTILTEIVDRTKNYNCSEAYFEIVATGCHCADGFDLLNSEEWLEIYQAARVGRADRLHNAATRALARHYILWDRHGRPRTLREWWLAKYPELEEAT